MEWVAISSPVDHVLPELFTVTCPSWVALHRMAHSLTELCKTLCHDKAVTREGIGLKQKQCSAVVVSGGEHRVRCCKEQYCIGTWNVRPVNQGKWDVVKQAQGDNGGQRTMESTGSLRVRRDLDLVSEVQQPPCFQMARHCLKI